MARFAMECMTTFKKVVHNLETALGPETGDLGLRIGLNSGQVTAGVLRGEKSRFQLFGDTVNTASRMESTGKRNRIHVSQTTAKLIMESGKKDWLQQREDPVEAKGKGTLVTYWLNRFKTPMRDGDTGSMCMDAVETNKVKLASSKTDDIDADSQDQKKKQRLINWNVDILLALLKNIVAQRDLKGSPSSSLSSNSRQWLLDVVKENPRDEIKEMINGTCSGMNSSVDPSTVEISEEIQNQVRDYVTCIANMYRDNPFHNFQHASHVTMSVTKLMSRIELEGPNADDMDASTTAVSSIATANSRSKKKKTKGTTGLLTADPLTPFACALSALIHDLDHPGVSNVTLVEEEDELAKLYKNRSVAEQNSIDLAWDLLFEPRFEGFRNLIYTTKEELVCFRQLVVNSVMATDIMDKELKNQRNERWAKVFDGDARSAVSHLSVSTHSNNEMDDLNRKAIVILDHLIQASDVSHTMQHWHVYLGWNEKFFGTSFPTVHVCVCVCVHFAVFRSVCSLTSVSFVASAVPIPHNLLLLHVHNQMNVIKHT
jgi:3'5'-cyclic nucleotide phosphodiesterase/Adenylate and Guanylate cyclase catalytic domain